MKKNESGKSLIASSLKAIAIIIMIVLGGAGFGIGFMLPEPDMGFLFYPALFAVAGVFIGFLITIFLFYLSELGKNIKKTTDATQQLSRENAAAELMQYKELLDSGAISQQEYEKKKQQLLNQ